MKNRFYLAAISSALFLQTAVAQTDEELTATVLHQDSLFWDTYNKCNTIKNKDFLTDDVEFYHDKGGITLGDSALAASIKNNLCSNPDFRIRREAIPGAVHVFPMRNSSCIYGAIISGEHLFYVKEKNKNERPEGHARFTHVWILQNKAWKMKRILSYDHGPAIYINKRKTIYLPSVQLNKFLGRYKGEKSGNLAITADQDHLLMHIGNKEYSLFPENKELFFTKDRDLTFKFIRDTKKVTQVLIYESGNLVEQAVFVSSSVK